MINKILSLVQEGEINVNKRKRKIPKFDWKEFWHMSTIWFLSGVIIFIVLIAITMAESSQNIWIDVIKKIDTLSLMFSLVLSALMEQMWNNKKSAAYKFTQVFGIIIAVIGLVLYLLFSILNIYNENNSYLQNIYGINLGYIIVSVVYVMVSFIARAFDFKEEK